MHDLPADIWLLILAQLVRVHVPHPRRVSFCISELLGLRLVCRTFSCEISRELKAILNLPNLPRSIKSPHYKDTYSTPLSELAKGGPITVIIPTPYSPFLVYERDSYIASALYNSCSSTWNRHTGTPICAYLDKCTEFALSIIPRDQKRFWCRDSVLKLLCTAATTCVILWQHGGLQFTKWCITEDGKVEGWDQWCIAAIFGNLEWLEEQVEQIRNLFMKTGRMEETRNFTIAGGMLFGCQVACATMARRGNVVRWFLDLENFEKRTFGAHYFLDESNLDLAIWVAAGLGFDAPGCAGDEATNAEPLKAILEFWFTDNLGASRGHGPLFVTQCDDMVVQAVRTGNVSIVKAVLDVLQQDDLTKMRANDMREYSDVYPGSLPRTDEGMIRMGIRDHAIWGKTAAEIARSLGCSDIEALLEEKSMSNARAGGQSRIFEQWFRPGDVFDPTKAPPRRPAPQRHWDKNFFPREPRYLTSLFDTLTPWHSSQISTVEPVDTYVWEDDWRERCSLEPLPDGNAIDTARHPFEPPK